MLAHANARRVVHRIRDGGGDAGQTDLSDELRATGFVLYHTALLGTLAQGLAGVGQVAQGLATIDWALAPVRA